RHALTSVTVGTTADIVPAGSSRDVIVSGACPGADAVAIAMNACGAAGTNAASQTWGVYRSTTSGDKWRFSRMRTAALVAPAVGANGNSPAAVDARILRLADSPH